MRPSRLSPKEGVLYDYPTVLLVDKFQGLDGTAEGPHEYLLSDVMPTTGHPEFLSVFEETAIGCWLPQPEGGADDLDHGVMVLGLLAAPENTVGIVGLIPPELASSIRVIPATDFAGTISKIERWLAEHATSGGRVIINMSLDFPEARNWRSIVEEQLDVYQNVLWVVSAGNVDDEQELGVLRANCERFPACIGAHDNAVAVSSLYYPADKPTPRLADKSRHGTSIVSVAAPGVEILVPRKGLEPRQPAYTLASGSSFAAAFVTAAAATIWALDDA